MYSALISTHLFKCLWNIFSEDPNALAVLIVRDILYSTKENVNFVHEVYRQAFLLNFTHSPAIRKAIAVYKDWIQMNVSSADKSGYFVL